MSTPSTLFLLIFSCFVMGFPCFSHAQITFNLLPGQQLRDSEHLLSPDGVYKLGFFNPTSSSNQYLGIWYSKLPHNPAAVWVANPYNPILDASGVLSLDSEGNLRITYSGGQLTVLNSNPVGSRNVTAVLLNSGNFVLKEVNSDGTTGQDLWQSFDYPTNTLLPGMKLGMNIKTGHRWTLSSWLSDKVPEPGAFRLGLDTGGASQLIVWRREDVYWSSGAWKDGRFQMAPELTGDVDLYEFSFVSNENEKYFSYSVRNNSTISRWEVNSWGQIVQFTLAADGVTWQNIITSPCKLNSNYPDAVCIEEKKPSKCRNGSELFVPTRGFFEDTETANSDYNTSSSLSDCHGACWNDCSCVAYKSHFDNGTGCDFWSNRSSFKQNDNFEAVYILTTGENKENTKKGSKGMADLWWIWCIIIIAPAIAMLLLGYFCYRKRRNLQLLLKTGESETSQEKGLIELRSQMVPSYKFNTADKFRSDRTKFTEFQLFSFTEIAAATDDFSFANKLGEGGFGPVYKGTLLDGQQVAVKRLGRNSGQGPEEFMNEITLIAELQHRNLVRLFGCCVQGEEKMLIYEYMSNKSLDSFLFDPAKRKLLGWKERIDILEGIAQGLLYLHRYSRVRIIHRDLKASNILLDDDMSPKISDFGMARIFGQNESKANTNRVVGTYGYMSPEYAMNGIFSVKSDVFSFGVLLLEIISGKKNNNFSLSGHLSLIEHALQLWKQGDCLELMDSSLDSCPKNDLYRYMHIGLLCVQESAEDRPTMSEIISMLTNDIMFLPDPKQPAYYVGRSEASLNLQVGTSDSDICSVNSVSITVMEPR